MDAPLPENEIKKIIFWGAPNRLRAMQNKTHTQKKSTDMIGYVKEIRVYRVYRVG